MIFQENAGVWTPVGDRFTVRWEGMPTPPPLEPVKTLPTTQRRNMADVIYNLPEMRPFKALDLDGLADSVEPGDKAPEARPFFRRLLGQAVAPLTLLSRNMDTLPLNLRPESAQPDWLRYLLICAGVPLVTDLPQWAYRKLARRLHQITPLGRTWTFIRFLESLFGRGERLFETATDPGTGTITLTTTLTTPDGDTYEIEEVLPKQNPTSITSTRSLKVQIPADAPDWLERQLKLLYPSHFTPNVERQP